MKNNIFKTIALILFALSGYLPALQGQTSAKPPPDRLMGNRFLTLNTVIRVNQIEVTRDRNVGEDERLMHTPQRAAAFREQVNKDLHEGLAKVSEMVGIGGSDANLKIRWFMNKDFRLALMKDWQKNRSENVIDFTSYQLKAEEPTDMTRKWSLLGEINQKQTRPQDKPMPVEKLSPSTISLIKKHYPYLFPNH